MLESEGFVNFVHNRGAWVTPLSLADLEDIYTIRIELECEAVRRAEPFSKAEIAHLDDLLRPRSPTATNAATTPSSSALNRELHFAIYEKANSPAPAEADRPAVAALGPVPAAVSQLPERRLRRRAPSGGHQAPAAATTRVQQSALKAHRTNHGQPHPRSSSRELRRQRVERGTPHHRLTTLITV